jgi:hypothetical protein
MKCPDCDGEGCLDSEAGESWQQQTNTCWTCAGEGELCDACRLPITKCPGGCDEPNKSKSAQRQRLR